jgi:hypothetical protein
MAKQITAESSVVSLESVALTFTVLVLVIVLVIGTYKCAEGAEISIELVGHHTR